MTPPAIKELKPRIVLGIGAHPDDLEFYSGGSLAKWAAAGAEVYYLLLTGGGKGTEDPSVKSEELVRARQQEQRAASSIIGAQEVFFTDFEDGALENNYDTRREIVRYIRQLKPDVVVAWDPAFLYSPAQGMINHPDHRTAGQASLDALYPLARDPLSFPELLAEGLKPHNVSTVLLQTGNTPNYWIDISDQLEIKLQALDAHVSQIKPATKKLIQDWAHQAGEVINVSAAESFIRIDLAI